MSSIRKLIDLLNPANMSYTSSFPESFLNKTLKKPEDFNLPLEIEDITSAHKWRLKHYQSCCEGVDFHSSNGTWPAGPITSASFVESDECPSFINGWESYDSSHTWTALTLSDGIDMITLAFLGESNGYYSEDVSLEYLMENETK